MFAEIRSYDFELSILGHKPFCHILDQGISATGYPDQPIGITNVFVPVNVIYS